MYESMCESLFERTAVYMQSLRVLDLGCAQAGRPYYRTLD